ncbi:MAG: flagellar hook protein FlgE [Fimbriimonadaceae bacterium]|nr:flagellar hook protein FlgE [Fimbriimonadaceae bacterium]
MLAGAAAIRAHQSRMNVIGNNLANINTTAFRASRLGFMDLMSNTLRGASAPNGGNGGLNPVQIGTGVMIGSTSLDPSNGSMSATNRPTDLALAGNGFFVVGNGTSNYYTRDGGFDLDASGNLVHRGTGLIVQGWTADANGAVNASGATGGLRVPTGVTSSAHGTTTATIEGNLNAAADGDAEVRTTMTVYDSLGNSRQVSVRFFNHTSPAAAGSPAGATSSWDWEALDGTTVVGSSATAGSAPLFFDGNGAVVGTGSLSIALPGTGGASDQTVAVNVNGVRQLAQSSQVRLSSQDGYGPGSLTSFSIVPDGTVVGIFSNGQTQALGRIATAVFANPGGMNQEGGNLWSPSGNSGDAIVGAPGAAGQPAVYAGYLETSNVDLGTEFTDMIVTQRGYQANTRVITTADEMMQEALQIKR